MGCARSKSKKQENVADSDEKQESLDIVQDNIEENVAKEENLDGCIISETGNCSNISKPIETVYEHQEASGDSTSVLRTTYVHDKKFTQEETINLLKDEAYKILQNEINRPLTFEMALKLVQSSIALTNVNNEILEHAVRLIRSGEMTGMAHLLNRLTFHENRQFSREEADECVRALFIFSEDRASKSSLLKIIHEKLEKSHGRIQMDNILRTPLDCLQLDSNEHENVEVTVKKSVKHRSITLKELEERGLKAEDVVGKEVYIVSKSPEGLDDNVRSKAEELMHAAGSIYDANNWKINKPTTNYHNNINEISKIMEAHKQFTVSSGNDIDKFLNIRKERTNYTQSAFNDIEKIDNEPSKLK